MTNNRYLQDRAARQKFVLKGAWITVTLAGSFVLLVLQFAASGTAGASDGNFPDRDDAYQIARQYVRPTIHSLSVDFPETDFECISRPGAVFLIRSHVDLREENIDLRRINWELRLKYLGGPVNRMNSWRLEDISEK